MRKINISAPFLPQTASPTLGQGARWAAAPQPGEAGDQILSPFVVASLSSSYTFSLQLYTTWLVPINGDVSQAKESPGLPFALGEVVNHLLFGPCPWTVVWVDFILWHISSLWSLLQLPHLCCREGRVWFLCLTHNPHPHFSLGWVFGDTVKYSTSQLCSTASEALYPTGVAETWDKTCALSAASVATASYRATWELAPALCLVCARGGAEARLPIYVFGSESFSRLTPHLVLI